MDQYGFSSAVYSGGWTIGESKVFTLYFVSAYSSIFRRRNRSLQYLHCGLATKKAIDIVPSASLGMIPFNLKSGEISAMAAMKITYTIVINFIIGQTSCVLICISSRVNGDFYPIPVACSTMTS
jgi:hypothetical protein